MRPQAIKFLNSEGKKDKKSVMPLIGGIILIIASIIITNVFAFPKMVRTNHEDILSLQNDKVDQEKFNEFLKVQNEFVLLLRERQEVLCDKMEGVEKELKVLKEQRLKDIEIRLTVLETMMTDILKQYGLYTRDGKEVIIPIEYYITPDES